MVDKYNPGSRSDHGANVHGFILISSLYPNHTTILIIFHYIPLYPIISHYIPWYPIISHYIYISHYIPWYPMISHYIPLYPIISLYPIYPCFMLIMLLFKSPFLTVKKSRLLTAASRSFRPISSTSCSLVSTSNADVWSVVRLWPFETWGS